MREKRSLQRVAGIEARCLFQGIWALLEGGWRRGLRVRSRFRAFEPVSD